MNDHALSNFITAALIGKGGSATFLLGMVSGKTARLVQQAVSLDISGYARTLSSGEVRHIFKSHGDPVREAARHQQAVRKWDLARIVQIIDAATAVSLKGEERSQKPRRLVYTSHLDGATIEYVETIHPARRALAVKTVRKW